MSLTISVQSPINDLGGTATENLTSSFAQEVGGIVYVSKVEPTGELASRPMKLASGNHLYEFNGHRKHSMISVLEAESAMKKLEALEKSGNITILNRDEDHIDVEITEPADRNKLKYQRSDTSKIANKCSASVCRPPACNPPVCL